MNLPEEKETARGQPFCLRSGFMARRLESPLLLYHPRRTDCAVGNRDFVMSVPVLQMACA